MNANAGEWTPNFGASEWSPSDDVAAPAAPSTNASETTPDSWENAPEQDELYGELQQLLSAGEINEAEFVDALVESNLPVPPEMKARVDAFNLANASAVASKKAEQAKADAAAAKAEKEKAAAVAQAAAAPKAPTSSETKTGPKISKQQAKADERNKKGGNNKKAKPIPKNTKTSEHPDPDPRPHANMVFIGHVDAGKSTIAGTVMFLTGNVDQRLIDKYEREAKERGRDSWYMAYIMDTNDEERAKGKTVEVGMAHFTTDTKRFTVLDAPGHANYVPNMIAGAAQADIGVLVVSARPNEFEQGFDRGGQTREHAVLAKTLGVSKLIILVNKMDCTQNPETDQPEPWSQGRFKHIRKNLAPFLRSIGYKVKRDVSWVCCSGLHGDNIKSRFEDKCAAWMPEKRSFLEVVDSLDMTKGRNPDGPLRIPILDKYANRGTWVMGKIEQGTLRDGDTIGLLPNRERVVVEEIQIADAPVSFAKVGDSVAIKLKNVSVNNVQRGFVLTCLKEPMPCVDTFSAQIQILDLLPQKSIMTAGYKCILHTHTAIEECTVSKLLANIGKNGKPSKGERPGFAKSNQGIVARIKLNRKVCVHTFDQMAQLGRFTLRDEGKTIAIGKIIRLGK